MRIAIFATFLSAILMTSSARADERLWGSSFWWPGWNVETSETLLDACDEKRREYSHPLISAFDGDAKTTWEYQPNFEDAKRQNETREVRFLPHRTIFVDALRLLNGGGAPLRRIRVTMLRGKNRIVRSFTFSSRKGWKLCRLPRTQIDSLRIEFPKSQRLNIAEIEMQNRGHRVRMAVPRAVMFADGMEGCKSLLLLNRRGRVLEGIAAEAGLTDKWNRNGRYVCGSDTEIFWIYDVWRGRSVKRLRLRDWGEYKWLSNKRVLLVGSVNVKSGETRQKNTRTILAVR